jgi:hypothetical protein
MTDKLSPEGEVLAAHVTATIAAFKVLILTLENNGSLTHGEFPAALRVYMEKMRTTAEPVTLALLDDLLKSLLD